MTGDDDIDRAIDEAARDLTAGEPDGAFRARVLARIDAGESGRRRWAVWVVSPLAVALLVAVAIVMMDERGADRGTRETAQREAAALRSDVALEAAKAAPTVRPPRPRAMPPSEIDALAPPPLSVPSIALEAIHYGNSIQLQPLEPIAPIDVAPLSIEQPNREP